MPKPEKITSVSQIKEHLEGAGSVFVTDYTGLNVEQITKLRKDLRENSIRYLVAKNTLMRIAAKETGYDGLAEYLTGQTALAFGAEDAAAAAKILYDSFKAIEKPVIRAFVLDDKDQVFPGDKVVRLAELPSREVLYSQIVAAVEAPFSSLISSIDALFQELIATLAALEKSKA
ncbi:MAG: 50S ribosomal protein L10 [candidate division Zixibacteria bacterium]|nr:50S ribosomal protein L10 [candidate division Zixibacteria bacterium]